MSEEAIVEDEIIEETPEDISETEEVSEDVSEETEDEPGELVVLIGDEEPEEEEPEKAATWVTELRKKTREQAKKIKAFEAKEAERAKAAEKATLGDKPNYDDYDYSESDKFEADLIAWHKQKAELEAKKTAAEEEARANDERYQSKLEAYNQKKTALGIADIDDIEDTVKDKLSVQQHAIAIHALDKPELFMVALGRNQKELDRLAQISDPVIFAVEIGKIEAKLKTTTRKAPAPETRLKGNAPVALDGNKHLEKLEKDAERTGDRTAIQAYKRSLRNKA